MFKDTPASRSQAFPYCVILLVFEISTVVTVRAQGCQRLQASCKIKLFLYLTDLVLPHAKV
jgi:hypothetical protein